MSAASATLSRVPIVPPTWADGASQRDIVGDVFREQMKRLR
jgi:hypothetical protein